MTLTPIPASSTSTVYLACPRPPHLSLTPYFRGTATRALKADGDRLLGAALGDRAGGALLVVGIAHDQRPRRPFRLPSPHPTSARRSKQLRASNTAERDQVLSLEGAREAEAAELVHLDLHPQPSVNNPTSLVGPPSSCPVLSLSVPLLRSSARYAAKHKQQGGRRAREERQWRAGRKGGGREQAGVGARR